MEQAIQLFGYLILTVLGFVLPIMAILLSVFREGLSKLAAQYESERAHSEDNIKAQLQKMAKGKTTDESAIQRSLKELRFIKKTAEAKLSYLDPKKQVIRLFVPLIFAFLGVIVTLLLVETNIYYCFFLLISLIGFAYAIVVLWKLIGIIIEVRKIIDTDRKDTDSTIIELLSALGEKVEQTGQYYLKKVYVNLDDNDIKDGSYLFTMQANTEKELKISIQNREERMVKNVQIGLCFPTNFIIGRTDYYKIYRSEKEQIVRYESALIHGDTNLILEALIVTPLEKGEYKIETFIKAENIEATYRNVTARVT